MSRKISPKIIRKIKTLRKRGFSLSEIRKETKLGHGTVHRYTKDVQILPRYQKAWLAKRGGSSKRKKIAEERAMSDAKKIISSLSGKEKTIFLSALYWGEGNKTDFILSNSDPDLIGVFVKGLREVFKISNNNLRVSIRIYEDLNKNECLRFWSKIVGIKPEEFLSVNVLKGKKKGKLSYGMCRIRVKRGVNMLKYITAIKKEIIKLF